MNHVEQIAFFDAPEVPVLPTHSHAVRAGRTVYVSGQVGIPLGEAGPPECFADEVRVALDALAAALAAAGATLQTVLRTNCYLADMGLMREFNALYLERFAHPAPARTTIGATLAHGLRFEIDAIAFAPGPAGTPDATTPSRY